MNFKQDLKLLAFILLFIGVLMLVPLGISLGLQEQSAIWAFVKAIASILVFSTIILLFTRKVESKSLHPKDGYLFVTLTWILATGFGAVPLVLSGAYPDFSSAFFEIMSGFTTTGATVLTEIEHVSKGILFWRSMTNWLGGMGIVVLFVALLPAIGAGTFHLIGAESVGPVKGKLTPKTKTTAIVLWLIYLGFSFLQTILLLLGGLSLYDAVTVTFSTMSAAGFCVKNASIGTFGSAYVDVVVTTFMLIGGANFAVYYRVFTGKARQALKDGEFKAYLSIWGICTLVCALCLFLSKTYGSFLTALRYSAFQLASIMTTTGFSTTNYLNWPSFSIMLVILMMFIGGCAGSTGGGMKVIRVTTMFKMGGRTIKERMHPNGVYKIRSGNEILDEKTLSGIAAFCGIYLATWVLSSALIGLTGVDVETCFASTLLTLGNIGIGFGQVGPVGNFSIFPAWAKWLFSFLMLSGRLELFTVFVLFSRSFYRS